MAAGNWGTGAVAASRGSREGDGKVLVFAPGGFASRQPTDYAEDALAAAGFEPVVGEYPVNDIRTSGHLQPGVLDDSLAYAIDLAESLPGAHAIGFSAGASLVANLAARDLVERAVVVSGPSNLRKLHIATSLTDDDDSWWTDIVGVDRDERWRCSATKAFLAEGHHRRTLICHARDDNLVPFEQAEEMRDVSGGRLRAYTGGHGIFQKVMPRALRFLSQ